MMRMRQCDRTTLTSAIDGKLIRLMTNQCLIFFELSCAVVGGERRCHMTGSTQQHAGIRAGPACYAMHSIVLAANLRTRVVVIVAGCCAQSRQTLSGRLLSSLVYRTVERVPMAHSPWPPQARRGLRCGRGGRARARELACGAACGRPSRG
jgi:hypothetical protein